MKAQGVTDHTGSAAMVVAVLGTRLLNSLLLASLVVDTEHLW